MRRTWPIAFAVLMLSLALVSCINEADYAPKPAKVLDRVLFNRAADALDQGKFDVARITFQTLINTYPDSGYAAMAKWILENDPRLDCHTQTDFKDSLCNEGII